MLSRARNLSQEFPRTFWILTGATFVDQVGSWLLFPFFALYVTDHFGVGMTQVGILFAIFSVANLIGGVIGGALTDKLGRKWMLMFGLIALTAVAGYMWLQFQSPMRIGAEVEAESSGTAA
jgi:MFS family permease